MVAQVALSIILLAAAGLFVGTLQKLRAVDPGYRKNGVLGVRLTAKPGGYRNLDFGKYDPELTERISALPQVTSAAMVHVQPGRNIPWTEEVRRAPHRQSEPTSIW